MDKKIINTLIRLATRILPIIPGTEIFDLFLELKKSKESIEKKLMMYMIL